MPEEKKIMSIILEIERLIKYIIIILSLIILCLIICLVEGG